MLELAILGLLKEQDLHGYELKKRLADMLGVGSGVSFGSLYPALGRLEAAGAVRAVEERRATPVIPGTGSLGGELAAYRARASAVSRPRARKVYGVTERGEALFDQLLAAGSGSSDDQRAFNLRLAFARYLPPEARLGMLERRRAYLLAGLTRTRHAIRDGWERLDAYTRTLLEHGSEATERDISWLDRLIAHERASHGNAGDAPPEAGEEPPGGSPLGQAAALDQVPPGQAAAPAAAGRKPARAPRRARRAPDWAASTAPTMPAPPATTQGGTTR